MLRKALNLAQEFLPTARSRELFNRTVTMALPAAIPAEKLARALLDTLCHDGNVVLPEFWPADELRALRADLERRPCYDPWNPLAADFQVADTPADVNNARIRNVAENRTALAIANDPLVLQIVSNYLGCLPTIDDIVAWWSLPGRPAPKEEQFFHRDRDAVKFVKLFVYLSDVGENDGAHVFVKGSHRQNDFTQRRRRYQDEEVLPRLGAGDLRVMTGRFGATFLEDTYGLHKGGVPADHPRLVLQVRYTSYPSNWARKGANAAPDPRYDPYINRFVA